LAPKSPVIGGVLVAYLSFCVLVGAVWVSIAQRKWRSADSRQDLEALVGGMIIFGAGLALWFGVGRPLVELGLVADTVEGFSIGVLIGFVVTGLSLAVRVWTQLENRR